MRIYGFLLFVFTLTSIEAQNFKLLTWDDLKPQIDFKDPYEQLNTSQIYKMRRLWRYKMKQENPDIKMTPEELEDKERVETELTSQNIDYQYLFEIYPKVVEMRKRKDEDLNTELNNKPVELSGYLLPLNFYQEKASEFLLVPWVGACVHTPPPAKNQIVFIKSKEWITATTLFEPVHVEGYLKLDENESDLFLKDGTTAIRTGYSIDNANIFKL